MYFHEPTGQCYELYKQGKNILELSTYHFMCTYICLHFPGPCPEGHILSFNYGNLSPQCKCKDDYHLHSDGKCYKLNTKGYIKLLGV